MHKSVPVTLAFTFHTLNVMSTTLFNCFHSELWLIKVLDQVSPKPNEVKRIVALQNPTKNRDEDFLPGM